MPLQSLIIQADEWQAVESVATTWNACKAGSETINLTPAPGGGFLDLRDGKFATAQYHAREAFMSFDTSAVPDTLLITEVKMRFWIDNQGTPAFSHAWRVGPAIGWLPTVDAGDFQSPPFAPAYGVWVSNGTEIQEEIEISMSTLPAINAGGITEWAMYGQFIGNDQPDPGVYRNALLRGIPEPAFPYPEITVTWDDLVRLDQGLMLGNVW